jgi:hypothetical protein
MYEDCRSIIEERLEWHRWWSRGRTEKEVIRGIHVEGLIDEIPTQKLAST